MFSFWSKKHPLNVHGFHSPAVWLTGALDVLAAMSPAELLTPEGTPEGSIGDAPVTGSLFGIKGLCTDTPADCAFIKPAFGFWEANKNIQRLDNS